MKTYIICTVLLISIFTLGCKVEKPEITSFEECVAAGNIILESYPRQCKAGDKTFTEEIEVISEINIEQALEIAKDSECQEKGTLTDNYFYNPITKTWWIDLQMKPEFENPICSPACVINEETLTAEINWRCTGALT